MTFDDFKRSSTQTEPPAALSAPLRALWWAAKDEWDKAHGLVQDDASRDAAWVHAYLHRVEGDLSNANYWYRKAGKPAASGATDAEWDSIAAGLLSFAPE